MALTWNGFLDYTLCPVVCRTARSQTNLANTTNWENTFWPENFWKRQETKLMLRCRRVLSRIWQTVSAAVAQLTTEIRVRKAGNRLQGGGSHTWRLRHEISEQSREAWDLFPRALSLSSLLLLPFQEAHPQNAEPSVPGQVPRRKMLALLSPLLPVAQGTRWRKVRTRPTSPTAQTGGLAAIPSLSFQLWEWCLPHRPPAPAASPRCPPQHRWMKPEEQANICWETVLSGVGFVTPQGQIWLFPSNTNTKGLPFPHVFPKGLC